MKYKELYQLSIDINGLHLGHGFPQHYNQNQPNKNLDAHKQTTQTISKYLRNDLPACACWNNLLCSWPLLHRAWRKGKVIMMMHSCTKSNGCCDVFIFFAHALLKYLFRKQNGRMDTGPYLKHRKMVETWRQR